MIGKIWKSSKANAGRFTDFLGRALKSLATTFLYYDVEHDRRAGEAAEMGRCSSRANQEF